MSDSQQTELTMKDTDTLVLVSRDWRDRVLDEVKALRIYKTANNVALIDLGISDSKIEALTKERDTLAAQNVTMQEALNWLVHVINGVGKSGATPSCKECEDANKSAQQALAITPTEAVEKMRRKDAVAERIINACHCYKTPAPIVRYVLESTSLSKEWDASWKEIREAVEAARKEGVK